MANVTIANIKLPWSVRTRIGAVLLVSKLFDISIDVKIQDFHEYKVAAINSYVAACDRLFGPIFDEAKINDFHAWVFPMLHQGIDNIFNLYHHPLETVASYFGMNYETMEGIKEMNELYVKYRESGLNIVWYD